ncbi:MAG: group II intron maturase-specific domain-containing protein, partial [Gammaproteobacteria bacterium]
RYVRGWMTNRQESRSAPRQAPVGRGTRTSRVNYFGISDYYRPIPEIDSWIRRRIRMSYWKQWRCVRTKARNLPALGTSRRQAILTAISSKSYWHLSKTLATQTGMTNDWLQSQGLISVRALWMRAHGYT